MNEWSVSNADTRISSVSRAKHILGMSHITVKFLYAGYSVSTLPCFPLRMGSSGAKNITSSRTFSVKSSLD